MDFHGWFASWFDIRSYLLGALMGAIAAVYALSSLRKKDDA